MNFIIPDFYPNLVIEPYLLKRVICYNISTNRSNLDLVLLMKSKKAFTLIELLVVIAIIGILATVSIISLSNARAKSRDAKRAGDMKQIQTALELFFNDKGRYPTAEEWNTNQIYSTSTTGTSTYMQVIPAAPTPVDGNCTDNQNTFYYTQTENGNSYNISLCLGNTTGTLASGPKCLTPGGIIDVDCSGGIAACSASTACGETCSYGGENYPTVDIGGQCWMAKNMNIGDYIGSGTNAVGFDGNPGTNDDCVDVSSPPSGYWSCQGYSGIQKYCYDNDANNCTDEGGLYEWAETLGLPYDCNWATSTDNLDGTYTLDCPNSGSQTILAKQQGICPSGWHVPGDSDLGTNSDWRDLEQGLATDPNCDSDNDGCPPAGGELKETGVTHWNSPNTGATNSSGFTALPAGYRSSTSGSFPDHNVGAYFWSAPPSWVVTSPPDIVI